MNLRSRISLMALILAVAAPLAACRDGIANSLKSPCARCGVVESITSREVSGDASGAGAVVGAIAGGVIGHQFGSGRGNDAATVAGAAGGAAAGHHIEKEMNRRLVYDVTVRMESGEKRRLTFDVPPALSEGDEVEVTGNQIARI